MPESDAIPNEEQASPPEKAWQDKILSDAIGYTKGLVTILDSLAEGFDRRGRELEELRHRLTILQNERRTTLGARGGLETQMGALTAERDELRSNLEERGRDLDQLREALAQSQAALEARAREVQELQAATGDSTRQAGQLREIVRDLERDLPRLRQSSAQAQQEQAALRAELARTQGLLEAARKDFAASEGQAAGLRDALENERARAEDLQERLRALSDDCSGLNRRIEAARRSCREIAASVGGPAALAGEGGEAEQEGTQWAELVRRVRLQTEAWAQTQSEVATLRGLAEAVQEVLGATDALPERLRKIVAERALLRDRLQRLAAEWGRQRQERTEALRREQQLREENAGLAARVAALTGELEAQRADAEPRRHPPASDRQPQMAEAAPEQPGEGALQLSAVPRVTSEDLDARKAGARGTTRPREADRIRSLFGGTQPQVQPPGSPEESPPQAGPQRVAEEGGGRQDHLAGVEFECTLASPGEESPQPLRGRLARINEVGMVGAFERRLSVGQQLNLRLLRGDREFAVPGRVVEVQPSAAAPGAPPTFDHLVRFDHPSPDSTQRLRVFLFS